MKQTKEASYHLFIVMFKVVTTLKSRISMSASAIFNVLVTLRLLHKLIWK